MQRHALFVGINNYNSCPLNYARADAEMLYKNFHRHYDTTTVLSDRQATEKQIKSHLKSLKTKSERGDMLVFYFSGHGEQKNGVRYLNVPEYDKDGNQTGIGRISLEDIEGITNKKGVHRLFILDCCRVDSNKGDDSEDDGKASLLGVTFPIGIGLLPSHPNAKFADYVHRNGANQMPPVILSSSMPGQASYEDMASGHGFFTEALIQTIHSRDVRSFNDFRDRLDYVMKTFNLPCEQTPYFEGPIGADLPFWPIWTQKNDRGTGDFTVKRSLSVNDVLRAFRGVSCKGFYIGRKIPLDMRRNAWNKMRVAVQEHEILALYDDAMLFGHGEEGFAVTADGLYMRDYGEESVFIPWIDVEWAFESYPNLTVNEYSVNVTKASDAVVIKAIANGITKLSDRYKELDDDVENEEECDLDDDEHPEWPHVVAGDEEGIWYPAAGYDWVNPDDAADMSVEWNPGEEHPEWPHVVADKKKEGWRPAAGYDWVNPDDNDDKRVKWKPGKEHPEWPHVVAGDEEGIWYPAAGYDWVNPDDNDDKRVKWKPGKEHPEWPHVVADKKKEGWRPAAGYVWADPDGLEDGNWRVKKQH